MNGSVPPDELPERVDVVAPAMVNGNESVRFAPLIVSVWAPGARPAGMTTAIVTFPVPSAMAVASGTVVECAATLVVSPGVNPVPLMMTCWPGVSTELAPMGLPFASVSVADPVVGAEVVEVVPGAALVVVVPPAAVVVVVPGADVVLVVPGTVVDVDELGVVVELVDVLLVLEVDDVLDVDEVLEVDDVLDDDVELVEDELDDDDELDEDEDDELDDDELEEDELEEDELDDDELEEDELDDDVLVEGGGLLGTVHVTWAGLSLALVVNVICTFQYLSSCVDEAGPSVHAIPTLYVPAGICPGLKTPKKKAGMLMMGPGPPGEVWLAVCWLT